MNVYSSKQVRDACPVSFLFFSGVLEEKKKILAGFILSSRED